MSEQLRLNVAHLSQPYPKKDEDVLLVRSHSGLFAVFDGSGKQPDGRVAAEVCRANLSEQAEQATNVLDLSEVIDSMQGALINTRKKRKIEEGASTIALLAQIDRPANKLGYVQVGSGVIALLRGSNVERLNALKNDLKKRQKHLQAIKKGHTTKLAAEGKVDLEPYDRVIIASNGIHPNCLSSQKIHRANAPNPLVCAQYLIDASNRQDDKTVIVVDIN